VRVLVADDDDALRHVLQVTLTKWGYDVLVSRNGVEAWRILQGSDAPQMAILDWIMPGMDGIEVCREIRKRSDDAYIYLLLLTAKDRKEDVISGMDSGADDYIAKPFDPQELKVRLRAGRRILDLQAELLAARETLRYQATHDCLTGLLNRSASIDSLRNELDRAGRQGLPLSLLLADIDHFKQVNDSYGHTIGDAVLCEAARRMRSSVRTYDYIGRYGGEEFLFVLPGCDGISAMNQAERLKSCITDRPIELPRLSISFTLSMGAVVKHNATVDDLDSLIQAADAALYQAKVEGRNRIVMSGSSPSAPNSTGALVKHELV
jgi:diguanylate cyclase (GGDEF)-like protein